MWLMDFMKHIIRFLSILLTQDHPVGHLGRIQTHYKQAVKDIVVFYNWRASASEILSGSECLSR